MIAGRVSPAFDPIINMQVANPRGGVSDIAAVVDTGFNGWLTLPPATIKSLGLSWLRVGRASLADGSETLFDVFEAHVNWDGMRRVIPVDESDSDPLVGMQLMHGFELRIEAVVGGVVELKLIL